MTNTYHHGSVFFVVLVRANELAKPAIAKAKETTAAHLVAAAKGSVEG